MNDENALVKAASNIQHKVFWALGTADPSLESLVVWALRYLDQEVKGVQSKNTLEAKARDLKSFIEWYSRMNGHARIENWIPRDTQSYLSHLEQLGRSPSTINRTLATLRRFARWIHEQPNPPFAHGLPTRGIKELVTDEPEAKKLDRREVYQLFKAAENLVLTEQRVNARPVRNRAVLALLYFTGLRVSELCSLERNQYDGKYLKNVKRKGKARSNIYLQKDGREFLDAYLKEERQKDDPKNQAAPLLLGAQPAATPETAIPAISRFEVAHVLNRIAAEANKYRPDGDKIHLHPHRLRHTFGAEYRERSGSDTETAAALGHSGLKYVGRYVRKTREERESLLESLTVEGK